MNQHVPSPSQLQIVRPGHNAWRAEVADAVAFLVDADEYFSQLESTLRKARRSIRIVGWDFDPDIRLRPLAPGPTLGELLRGLADDNPDLEIHILVWAMGPIYSNWSLTPFRDSPLSHHPRIHMRFDTRHAIRGSHHQKIVTVDDAVAFIGGMDLTAGRWDTKEHLATSDDRRKPNGETYGPVHDVQAMVSGKAARAAAELTSWRWKMATGTELDLVDVATIPWPEGCKPDMEGCIAAIGRTVPGLAGLKARHETSRLTYDAIAAARDHIYVEAQYLASFEVGDRLSQRLREPTGPHVAVVVTSSSRGLLEQFVMAHNRDRLIRRLKKSDRFDRLRVMYAVVPAQDGEECEVLIHSKVLVVDDVFVRVGSSNLNNRSEGLDTECDLAVEARAARERQAIAAFRDRLLAEHLDASPEAVAEAIRRGSLTAAIDRLNTGARGLRSFHVGPNGGTSPLPGTALLDPKKPFRPIKKARQFIASLFSGPGRGVL